MPAEIAAGWPDLVGGRDPAEWKFDAPRGERLEQMVARVSGVLSDLRGLDGPVVIVTHGVTSRVLRCLALGRAPSELAALPGGQGVVHVIEAGTGRVLAP